MKNDAPQGQTHALDEGASGGKAGWLLLGGAALLAVASIGYNIYDGQKNEPGTEVEEPQEASIEDLRAAAEASSGDAAPWANLAFALYERREFADAAAAYEKALEIDDSEAVLWSALGEARVYASRRDPLPPEALEAFQEALKRDPQDPRARYFMAVKLDIDDKHDEAISAWLDLLSDSPPGAPWEGDLVRTIQQVGAVNDIDVEDRLATIMQTRAPQVAIPGSGAAAGEAASPSVRGPTAQQMADAGRLTPEEQRNMAEGMVSGLEARLQDNPGNLDGWVMLMRSRMSLGQPDKASEALQSALAANPGEAEELRRQAQLLGVQ